MPKSLYMTPQEFEKDQSPGPHLMDNSCYQSIALNKGQVKLNIEYKLQRNYYYLSWVKLPPERESGMIGMKVDFKNSKNSKIKL